MNLSGQCGLQNISDGANNTVAIGRQSEMLVTELHGRYAAQASRGNLYHAITPSPITVTSNNVSPLAAAGSPILALYNPPNSGRNAAILRHHIATISGTPGGPILWNFALNQSLTLAAANYIAGVPGNLTQASTSACQVIANIAASGALASQLLKIASAIPAVATSAAFTTAEEEAGTIIVPPGGLLSLAAYAAGTSHVLLASLSWEEFPV